MLHSYNSGLQQNHEDEFETCMRWAIAAKRKTKGRQANQNECDDDEGERGMSDRERGKTGHSTDEGEDWKGLVQEGIQA